MMNRHAKRFIVGTFCALFASVLAVTIGEAGPAQQEGPVRTDCQECHGSVVTHWQDSAHGQAAVDEAFQESWQDQGSPPECLSCHATEYDAETGEIFSEGIACGTCHSGQTGPHPETPMPTDPSSRLCGTCHVDTYAEWETSAHGEGELACVRCHNPHTTQLKVGNMRDLCTACHNQEGHFYPYTAHSQQGLQCTDCHLRVTDSPMGEGHGQRLHTFAVDLETCNQCHSEEMHFPADDNTTEASAVTSTGYAPIYTSADQEASMNSESLIEEPASQPVQSLNYLVVAAVGMGFGVAATPFAESWYRRLTKRD